MTKLLRFVKPYTMAVIAVLVLMFLQSISQLYLPTLMADIVDIGIANGDVDYMIRVGAIMLFVAALGVVCTVWANYLTARVGAGYGRILRSKVFLKIENFSLHEFQGIGTASLITRTTNDITQTQQVLIMIMRMMISAPMLALGGITMAVSKDTKLSLVLVVVVPILGFVIFTISRKSMPLFKSMQVKLDKLNLVLREELMGIRVVRAFNRTEYEKERFNQANNDLTNVALKANIIMSFVMPTMMMLMNFTTIALIWFGAMRIDNGNMQVGGLMAFIQYAMQIMFSLLMLSMMFVMVPRAQVSALRINEVLEIDEEIKDMEKTKSTAHDKGIIEFQNVTFNYPNAEQAVLSNITFTINPGEVTAIIGGTGSGKSTLISLIPRFYDVDSGSIRIDGIDVRELQQKELRAKIGFVPQKPVLFSGSIAENIRYGKEDATDDEINHAAVIAQATEFIEQMKDGFSSLISQGGINISGGQKQRLSIARALVRKPRIYIFDDSFSALDYKTDAKLRKALKEEISNATILIIAQRVSTVMEADKIIVLNEGRIVGIGRHKDLLEGCQVYSEIVSSQLTGEEIA